MKTVTIGWTEAITDQEISNEGPRTDFILHPSEGQSKITIADIARQTRAMRPNRVLVDGDVFYEIAEMIEALDARTTS